MEAARDEADRANRAKSEFLSRMSHELRTPLNAILGFAQLLEMGAPTPRQAGHVEQILKGGRHLLSLINEVLDLARIESGQVPLTPEPIRVRPLLAEVLDLIRPLAQNRSIRLDPGPADGPDLYVLADRQRLKQVLLNLFSNAVKYNREQGSVTCAVTEAPERRVRIEVRDTGPGIAPELCRRLFSPFERLTAAATDVEGTGLGLAVSKRLTEAMGGTIGCASVVGEGATFRVELPRGRAPQAKHDEGHDETTRVRSSAEARGRTVVYIEDNPDNLALVQGILAHRPHVTLLSAATGANGLDLARHRMPDLILLDGHLPDQKGDEVMRQIRADAVLGETPVIVVSADATLRQIERLRNAGASEYLTKPIDVSALLSLLDRYLNDDSRRTEVRTCPSPEQTSRVLT
jgi:CheY-like chemotaxis protein